MTIRIQFRFESNINYHNYQKPATLNNEIEAEFSR